MIVTPNNTTPAAPQASSTVPPATPTTPNGSPSVYYWQASIKIKAPPTPVAQPNGNGAASLLSDSSLKNTMLATIAASALVLGSALLL